MADGAATLLDDPALTQLGGDCYPQDVVDRVRDDLRTRGTRASESTSVAVETRDQYLTLMLRALSAVRDVLLTGRSNGTYISRTVTRAQRNLEVEEARLQLIRSADA